MKTEHFYELLQALNIIVACTGVLVTIMTGSSSDNWILLALLLQSLLITLNHNVIAILHISQSLHTNIRRPNLYSTNLRNSLTAASRTALVPIRSSTANRLLISLHYGTLKVFKSHAKYSPTDFFPRLSPTALCLLPTELISSVKVKVKVTLRLVIYRQSVRLGVKPLETHDQNCFWLQNSLL
jgi:hypothetical protein